MDQSQQSLLFFIAFPYLSPPHGQNKNKWRWNPGLDLSK